MKYIIGRNNFALTIFIPQDCNNNCPFCTSKENYEKQQASLPAVIESIRALSEYNIKFHDIVITGGEPFADLTTLNTVLNTVAMSLKFKNIYINTTLPSRNINQTIQYINSNKLITGINISRHLFYYFYEIVASDTEIELIKKPKHINCVLFGDSVEASALLEFANRYKSLGQVTFRMDYTKINQSNLHSTDVPVFKALDDLFGFEYSTNCHVCHTDVFGSNVVLHRGIEHSSIQFSKALEINDLIMRQDGTIYYDWGDDQTASLGLLSAIGSSDTYSSTASVAAKIVTKNIYGASSTAVPREPKKVIDTEYTCLAHSNAAYQSCGGC